MEKLNLNVIWYSDSASMCKLSVIKTLIFVICDLTGAKPTVDGHFRDLRRNVSIGNVGYISDKGRMCRQNS